MALGEQDLDRDFLERWLSGPPQPPQELGPMQRLVRWSRRRPLLAVWGVLVLVGVFSLWGRALWGWLRSEQTISQLKSDLSSSQEQLLEFQRLMEAQKHQIARQTEALREAQTAAQQAKVQYQQAHQQIEHLNTYSRTLQAENRRLQQELKIFWAWRLAGQAQDWVFVQPDRSLLLACEAVRIFLDQGLPAPMAFRQTLQDALAQMGLGCLEGQPPGISALALTGDARWLIAASEDRSVRVWHLGGEGPALASVLRAHTDTIVQILLTPDGRRLITTGQDGRIFLWDLSADGPSPKPLPIGIQEGPILTAALSADGRWLLTAGGSPFQKQYVARLWDLQAQPPGSRSFPLRGHQLPIRSVAFSPDLRWAITAGDDRTIRLYHLQAKYPAAEQHILTGHEKPVLRLAISPNSRWLVSASADGTARLWDLQTPEPANASVLLQGHADAVEALAIDAQSRHLATCSADGAIRLWNLEASNPAMVPLVLKGHEGPVHCLLFTPDGQMLLSGSSDQTVRLWDLTASDPAEKVLILRGHSGSVRHMSLSQDGRVLVTASDGTPDTRQAGVRIWRIRPEDLFREAMQTVGQKFSQTEQQEILASLRCFGPPTR